MIGRRIEQIGPTDISGLIANAVREGRTIEYKRTLPGGSDGDRKEFLADISSFANASGGDILYGIDAPDGVPLRVAGLQEFVADRDILRLESMIRDGLDPRVAGIRFWPITVPDSGVVFLIRVPRSWSAPHMVAFKDSSKFFARSSAGKIQMDTDELRSAFALAADLPTRVRAWRDDRIAKILAGETPVPVRDTAKLLLHLVPVDSFSDPHRIPVSALTGMPVEFAPMGVMGYNPRINLDGFLTHSGCDRDDPRGPERSYCQVFRSGRVEALVCGLVRDIEGRPLVASIWYEKELLEATARYMRALDRLGVQPPLIILATFLGVRGAVLTANHALHPFDRDMLVLPEILIEDPPSDLPRAMRPIFDSVWNACGALQSANYDRQGNWAAGPLRDVPTSEGH